jgi:RNA polymerase sigma-70 factor (ECF subfamily)
MDGTRSTSEARLVAAAQAGDQAAFRALSAPHLRGLRSHCARIAGAADGEDVLQETLLRAWTQLDRFEGRGSFKGWLYAIATNTGLNALAAGRRHDERRAVDDSPGPAAPGPHAGYEAREQLELALRAAVRGLPPRQRAVLILREALGWSAAEVAELLDTTAASVNSALQRARNTLGRHEQAGDDALDDLDRALLDRYVGTWRRDDVQGLVRLLRTDAVRTALLRGLDPRGGGWLRVEQAAGEGGTRYELHPAFALRATD